MEVSKLVPGIVLLVATLPCAAQLVSVQCCSEQWDFENITDCVGGANVLVRPPLCRPAATCVLGFGPDISFMDGLCAPLQGIPIFERGFCSSWSDESIPVVHQCVAVPNSGITLFEVYDDEQDGDLDVVDLAMFKQVYDGVPKLIQSQAELVSVECCIPDAVISEIAECLSGPGVKSPPRNCALESQCTAGFTATLEPGDWLYKTCAQSQDPPLPDPLHCVSWETSDAPAAFECRAAPLPGNSLFDIADLDGDVDVDLLDFAALQRDIADAN